MAVARRHRQVVHGFQRDGRDIDDGAAFFVGDLRVGWVKGIQRWTLGTRDQIE